MSNEVVADNNSIRDLIPGRPMSYDEAVRQALQQRAQATAAR